MFQTSTRTVRSNYSIGLGRLIASSRASTNGEAVGAPLAAACLRGIKIFDMSHKTVTLPLNQAMAFLKKEPLYASVSKNGTVHASIYHYVFRSEEVEFRKLNYWQFLNSQEICKLPAEKSVPGEENGIVFKLIFYFIQKKTEHQYLLSI